MMADNVLVVAKYSPDVGYAWSFIERFWIQIAEACAEKGSTCYLAYPELRGVPDSVVRSPLVPLECDFSDRTLAGLNRIISVVRHHQVAGIYFTDRPFRDPLYALLRSAGTKRIVNHDHTPGDRPPRIGVGAWVKSAVNRIRLTTCDLWLALSPLMRDRAVYTTRVPPHRCVVVQNGIDRESPGRGMRKEARRILGLTADQIAVVSVGRASLYKGVDFSVRLAAEARQRGLHQLVFLHLGDGPDLEHLKKLAQGLDLSDEHFRFVGRVDNVPTLLEGCDIAIHPAHGEGFSLAILEYMRAGLPVLVPDRPSVCQAVRADHTGLIYHGDDVVSALGLLLRLASDQALRRRMGQAAAHDMRRLYTWSRTRREFAMIADYLAGASKRPRPGDRSTPLWQTGPG